MFVTRFAPAPTGFLHLGHVVNALHVWGIARALGGRVLLRIEDHDRQRSRREYERAILEDLDWLGFVPDDPPTDDFRAGACRGRQSDRADVYESALARLRGRDASGDPRGRAQQPLVYGCDCTRRDLREAMDAAGSRAADSELRYGGRCAARGLPVAGRIGIRVRLEPTIERFVDLRHGLQEQRPFEQCGDLLVRDRDGNWTYQFAATVDDMEQGVNLVIRGDDLLASTGRQIQLARLLGRDDPPRFLHHGLIMKSATQKLSKADRDTSVRDMRAAGNSADAVIGRALHAAGFVSSPDPLARREAESLVAQRYSEAVGDLADGR
ncbi:MAG: tRNA glutamyl-Q(34) synthetase GluQRS [Acidobacteria bacterium]|nr:tRNA glutamyl-Q(34) synthetase GluQRS [Acidobacteriota bacterium]